MQGVQKEGREGSPLVLAVALGDLNSHLLTLRRVLFVFLILEVWQEAGGKPSLDTRKANIEKCGKHNS